MTADLAGKTALITGAGRRRGIGFAIARKLASCGTNIVITDADDPPPEEDADGPSGTLAGMAAALAAAAGVDAVACVMDVTDPASVAAAVDTAARRFGRVDVLVNNAGVALGVPAEVRHYDEGAWMKTIDVNLHGVFRVSRAVLPLMDRGGSIVNLSSRAGKVAPLWNGAYAVAKAGVIMLTQVMALELAGAGIRVNALCPGLIMTDMQAWRIRLEAEFSGRTFDAQRHALGRRVPLGGLGTPGQVAELAAFLASGASSYITGQAVNVCGGQTTTR